MFFFFFFFQRPRLCVKSEGIESMFSLVVYQALSLCEQPFVTLVRAAEWPLMRAHVFIILCRKHVYWKCFSNLIDLFGG